MKRIFLACFLLSGCAQSGYHYEAGDFFTQTPNDQCWTKNFLAPNTIGFQALNATVGQRDGLPARVMSVEATSGIDVGWLSGVDKNLPTNSGIVCHGTFTLETGVRVNGIVFVRDNGKYDNGVWKGATVTWISDASITDKLIRAHRLPPGSPNYYSVPGVLGAPKRE